MGAHYHWHGAAKRGHDALDDAKEHAAELSAKYPDDVFNAYRCWCRKFHVGHEPKPKNATVNPVDERLTGRLIGVLRKILNQSPPTNLKKG